MSLTRTWPSLAVLIALVAASGCLLRGGRDASAPPPSVHLLAYINVSSGCQQSTVDLLQSLPAKYPGVQVEIVDFGDSGPGAARWEQSGLKCMAIEIDGHSVVKYAVDGGTKVIAFHAPAGFYWEPEDLEAAVRAALQGTLQPATEEELAATGNAPPTPPDVQQVQSQRQPAGGN